MHPVGVEPTHLAALEPESSVYANFTTGATGAYYAINRPPRQWGICEKCGARKLGGCQGERNGKRARLAALKRAWAVIGARIVPVRR